MQNHYEILGIHNPREGVQQSQHDIRVAYRKAILRCHPDKSMTLYGATLQEKPDTVSMPVPTVDQVVLAYQALSTPKARAEYDRILQFRQSLDLSRREDPPRMRHTGVETVDLDDTSYDEKKRVWHRACRCGNEKGFMFEEQDLELHEQEGSVVTGCQGCSLWLKVTFQAVEANEGISSGGTAS